MSSEKKPDEKKQTPQVPPPPILTPQPQPITQGQQSQQGGQVNPIVKPPTQQVSPLPQIPPQYTPPPAQQPQRPMMQPTQAPYAPPPMPPYQRIPQQVPQQQAPAQYPPQYPQYPPVLPPMMQQYPPQSPPQQFIRPEEQLSVSGDVHSAFKYAMIIGIPLAIGGIVVALLASLAISIPAYVYLIMGVSVVLLSIALIITSYSWFRSLRILEGEIGKINQRLSNMQQVRVPPMQTQPMMPLPQQMQQRYVMPPLPPPYMQQPQPQGTSEESTNSNDYTQ